MLQRELIDSVITCEEDVIVLSIFPLPTSTAGSFWNVYLHITAVSLDILWAINKNKIMDRNSRELLL